MVENEPEGIARLSVDLPQSLHDRLLKASSAIGSDKSEVTRAAIELFLQVGTSPLLSIALLKVQTRTHHISSARSAQEGHKND